MSIPLDDICRACMSVGSMMGSIFDEFVPGFTLADRMMAISSVKIKEGDGLPKFICFNCAQKVNLSFEFKKICENSDAGLKEYLKEELEKQKLANNRIGLSKPRVQVTTSDQSKENKKEGEISVKISAKMKIECDIDSENKNQRENISNIQNEEITGEEHFVQNEKNNSRIEKSKKIFLKCSPLKKRSLIMQPLKTKLKDDKYKKKSYYDRSLQERLAVKTNTYMGCEHCGTASIINNKLPDIKDPKCCRDCNLSVDYRSHLIIHVNENTRLCFLQCLNCYFSLGNSCEKSYTRDND